MKKRIISLLLSLVIMATFIFPMNVFADEETTRTYTGNGYEITYDIKGSWVGNQNVEVTIKNIGTESLLNWALKYDAHGEINGLWNGTVFSYDSTKYIVKNSGYNYEIQPEQSVTFGYTLSGEYMEFPEAIELCSQRTERTAEGYSVTMDITNDWDTGFTGTVTIKNLGESSLEAWRLSFDTNFVIEDIWNAQILSSFENSYTVANDITTTPIGAGESKIFGFKATKESGVTPEMTDFIMSEITVNEDFTTIDIPEITLAVSGFANYLEEENALNIFWYSNIENGRFELLESYNNEDFITTVILNNEYSYTYPITMDFDKRYFKVIQTTDDGQTAESPVFYVEKTEVGYSAKFIDSDGDGLPDFVEEQIGTDINKEDTDGDGLTDYQEYYVLGTDPLVYDSVTEGVSDADADCDSDGLSNIREFELGTKPFNPDTDNDGLTDGDEVNIYGTDPLKYDTDDDGISDGDEIAMGTDPLSPTTDGIADTERTFVQTIEADDEILEDINTEYNPYDLSLEITAAGNAHSSLTVQESGYSDSMFNWSILGVCPELIYDSTCKVDEVVLKFKVDEEYIANPDSEYAKENPEFVGIKRYNVFRFFEEDNILLPVKTDVDVENNTVSATVSDLGTYCLIDMECFLQDIVQGAEDFENENTETEELPILQTFSLAAANVLSAAAEMAESTETEPDKKVKPAIKYSDEFNVVFMYDIGAEGYSDFYNSVCDTTDFIFNKSENANVYFVELDKPSVDLAYSAKYESGGYVDEDKYDFHDSFLRDRNFWDNKDADSSRSAVVSDALDFVVNGIKSRDGSYTEIVDTDLPTLCFSFFSDESAVYRESTGYSLINKLVSENVFVNLIGNYDFSSYVGGYAEDLYQQTGGKYFKMNGENISDTLIRYIYELSESEDIPDLESKYPMILSTGLEYVELDKPISIDYIYAASRISSYNRGDFSDYADTDKDGLYDFEEINFSSQLINTDGGRVVIPTFGECIDYYGDRYFYVEEGLDRFLESAPDYLPTADAHSVLYNTKVLPIKSDPTAGNTDGDDYTDYDEYYKYFSPALKDNTIILASDYEYIVDYRFFSSYDFMIDYESGNDIFYYVGNVIVNYDINYVELYKSGLMDYLINYREFNYSVEDQVTNKKNNTYKDSFVKIVKKEVAKARGKFVGKQNESLRTLKNLISKYQYYKCFELDVNNPNSNANRTVDEIIDFYEATFEDSSEYAKLVNHLNYEIKYGGQLISLAKNCKEALEIYSDLSLVVTENSEERLILEMIRDNTDNIHMYLAADELLNYFDDSDNYIGALGNTLINNGIKTGLKTLTGLLLPEVTTVIAYADIFLNIGQRCKSAVKTYQTSLISKMFAMDLQKEFNIFDEGVYYFIYEDSEEFFSWANILVNTEIVSEDTYILYRSIPPTIIQELLIAEQNLVMSNINRLTSIKQRLYSGDVNG